MAYFSTGADTPDWNRKEKYVPRAINATLRLMKLGYVQVFHESIDQVLDDEAAVEAVSTAGNWWIYDSEDGDSWEQLPNYGIYVTAPGDELLRSLSAEQWSEFWSENTFLGPMTP